MKRRLYLIAFGLFLPCFAYDLVTWGAMRSLPVVGPSIANAALREAPIATTYLWLGQPLDDAVPPLRKLGAEELSFAFAEGWSELRNDPTAAMDLVLGSSWSAAHGRFKFLYRAAPALLLLAAILWWFRPKPIRLMGQR